MFVAREQVNKVKQRASQNYSNASSKTSTKVSGIQSRDSSCQDQKLQNEMKIERTKLLTLAMKWDCIKVAKEYIFQNSLDNIQVAIFSASRDYFN